MTSLAMHDLGAEYARRRAARGEAAEFLAKACAAKSSECILWPFSLKPNGYASIGSRKEKRYAHRVACEAAHGAPPSIIHEAAHSCGNRSCVNPMHLRWALHKENHADRLMHGTSNRGTMNGNAVLTEELVRSLRQSEASIKYISMVAREAGCHPSTIKNAIAGRTWGWLK